MTKKQVPATITRAGLGETRGVGWGEMGYSAYTHIGVSARQRTIHRKIIKHLKNDIQEDDVAMHVTDGPRQQSKWPPQATVIMMIETAQTPSLETSILFCATRAYKRLGEHTQAHPLTPVLCAFSLR